MHNALVIFRKDVRHLWPQIAVFLALAVIRSFLAPSIANLRALDTTFQIEALFPLAWCYLIVTVIQQERIPGDRQYWLARPVIGYEIVLAKAIFIGGLMHLPLLISHTAELGIMGMAPGDIIWGLIWRQCLLAAIVTLPTAAIAAATRNLAQFIFAALGIGVTIAVIRDTLIEHPTGPWWIRPAGILLAALGAAAAIRMLYSRRDTTRARVILAGTAALFIGAMFTDGNYFTPVRMATGPPQIPGEPPKAIQAWIQLEGAPPTADIFVDAHSFSANRASIRDYADGRGVLVIGLDDTIPTFQFAGQLDLTLYKAQDSIPIPRPNETIQLPGVGVCGLRRAGGLICLSPRPRFALLARTSFGDMQWIVPPAQFALPSLFESVDPYGGYDRDMALLVPAHVLARVRGQFDLKGARP
jgi:hypothetical protein